MGGSLHGLHPFILYHTQPTPFILYLNSPLLATFYTLSFLDYILEATHLLRLLRLLINLRYFGYFDYFGYSRYSLTSLTQPTIYIYIYIYIYIQRHPSQRSPRRATPGRWMIFWGATWRLTLMKTQTLALASLLFPTLLPTPSTLTP